MDRYGYGYGHDQMPYGGGERRLGVVSGKGFGNTNQIHATRPPSQHPPPIYPAGTRASQVAAKPWGFSDPETKRRRRIAKYKAYTVEGKVQSSLRSGIRWIKNKCSRLLG